ncbi:MupA/Atu3671 family FMN-dependent luciferase-like monooxygenase [Kitasatospora xanthocidica]|uniref:MupA/Atu3671 family FMN-dependent luciferase-like monooxygenase n=1 Tax=Kitasatospora xanthocidica TaxID=83382 RepID=UPI0036E41548
MAETRSARLSFGQERFWFLEQLAPGQAAYHLPVALRLRGALDEGALRRALTAVVGRHEALRTRFVEVGGRAYQVVEDAAEVELPLVAAGEAELPALLREETARPFALDRAPLLRGLLVRLGAEEHVLLLVTHHIVSDAASTDLLLEELAACYRAEVPGDRGDGGAGGGATGEDGAGDGATGGGATADGETFLQPLDLHYADFADWQREQLAGPALAESLAHWREHLADAPPLLELPADRTRPAVQTYAGAVHRFELGAELTDGVLALGAERGATPFMTLLAGFLALLQRATGREDLLVGTPVANRPRPELDRIVGPFTNTLVVRAQVGGDLAFGELVDRVRAEALAAFPHAEVPFERLVDELAPARELSHAPLVQLLFAYHDTGGLTLRLPGITVERVQVDQRAVPLDLMLTVERHAHGATGVIEYNTDLFDPATVERLAGQLTTLLAGAVARPGLPLSRLPLATAADAAAVERLNDTSREHPRGELVHERIAEQARRTPDAVAVVHGGVRLGYAELDARANALAHRLVERGVGPEQLVAVALRRTQDLPVALLAVLKAGAGYVPVDPDYPEARRRQMLADSGATVVLTSVEPLAEGEPTTAPARTVRPENPAYVIYTSGSTGTPKGVTVPHRALTNFLHAMDEQLTAAEGSVWLATTSVSFDIAALELLWTLARGVTVVLRGEERHTPAVDFSLFYFASADGGQPGEGGRPDDGGQPEDTRGQGDAYRLLLEGARFADRHGFAGVWTPERHFHPFGGLYPNPAVTGAAVAAVTERLAVRAGSVVLPLNDPLRVAEEWAIVDGISGGRAEVSFASGWLADDFVLAPERYADRKRLVVEELETVRELWRGGSVRRTNGAGRDIEVRTYPRPVRPELPVWLTSSGDPATFEAAGRAGAHLLTHLLGQDLDGLGDKVRRYRRAWTEAGHPGRGRVALMVHTAVDADERAVRERARQPFVEYLRSSLGLVKQLFAGPDAIDPAALPAGELEALLERYYDQFAAEAGLFGSPESCAPMVERIAAAGVDEIACLIDFGIDPADVLASLPHLDALRARFAAATADVAAPEATGADAGADADQSVPAQLVRHGVTHLQCTPSLANALAETDTGLAALGKLEQLVVGGEAFPAGLAHRLAEALPGRVLNLYGPTETTIWSSAHRVVPGGPPPIGRPVANTRFHLVDADGEPVPVGTPGELLIGGEGVARGYWGRPDLTADRFVPDPFGPPGARLYRTGDLAVLRPDGAVEFRGRLDDQVKLRGRRIELGEIEAHLETHPGVDRAVACVSGVGDRAGLVGYVRLRDAVTADGDPDLVPLPSGGVVAIGDRRGAAELHKEIFEDEDYLGDGFLRLWDGMTVVDAGANVGAFTLWAHRGCRPGRIVSVEPIPATFDRLGRTVRANGIDAVLVNAGLAAVPGTAEFTYYPQLSGLSGRYADPAADIERAARLIEADAADVRSFLTDQYRHERVTCRLTTLHDVLAEHRIDRVDLLKIDVERAEMDVLAGLAGTDWPGVRQVAIEVEGDDRRDEALAELERRGFETATRTLLGEMEVYLVYGRRPGLPEEPLPAATPAAAPPTEQQLREHLARVLPGYLVPDRLVTVPDFPLTPNGKVDRRALAAASAAPPAAPAERLPLVAPRNALERRLAEVWCRVLGVDGVGVHENFFDAGGNSLLLIRVHAHLAEALPGGTAPRLVELFAHPTIAALAAHLDERGPVADEDRERRRDARSRFHRRRRTAGSDG